MTLESNDTLALKKQADALLASREYTAAAEVYGRLLTTSPRDVNVWINLGFAQWSLAQHELALASLNNALRIDPDNALALLNKGNALSGLNRHDDALACYDRALEIDSGLARAWYNKGDELGRRSRIIEAKACFQNAYDLGVPEAQEMIQRCNQILMNDFYG